MNSIVTMITEVEDRLVATGMKRRYIAKQLCKEADVADTTYRRWRNGENAPNMSTWLCILGAAAKMEKRARDGVARRRRRNAKRTRTEAIVSTSNR